MAQNNTLGRNIEFPIMNSDGTPFHALVLHKTTYESTIMSLGDKITGDVYYADNTLAVTMQEYIEYGGVHYVLVTPPTIVKEGIVSDNGQLNGMTKYSFTFYHPMYMLSNFPFSDVAVTSDETQYLSESKKFSWCGTGIDFIAKLNKNLENTQWVVVASGNEESLAKLALLPSDIPTSKSTDTAKSNVLTFDNAFVADALKTMYDTWEVPFVIDNISEGEYFDSNNNDYYYNNKRFVIVVGLPSNEILDENEEPFVFQFGKGVGLKNNSRTPRNNKIVTRIAGIGSERNIPYGYPQVRWYGTTGAKFTYGDAAGVYTNVTIGGHTFAKVVSYPIYKGILGGQYVELIKHPFTRKTLMPSVYAATLFNKISPYLSNGSYNPNYNPDITIIDYYDATEGTYPNPIVQDAPSYEVHQFENVYPRLNSRSIVGAQPWDTDNGGSYYTYSQWYAYIYGRVSSLVSSGKSGYELSLMVTLRDVTCPYTPAAAESTEGAAIAPYSGSWDTGSCTATITVTTDENWVYAKIVSTWYNATYKILQPYGSVVSTWDDSMDDDGNYNQSYFKITLPQLDFDLYACASITEQMNIVMRSGACIGCTFEVSIDWDDYKSNFFHQDGTFDPVPHTTENDGHVRDASKYPDSSAGQIVVVVKKDLDTFGTLMPNIYQQPTSGDEFVFTGISLPESYITNAQIELDETSQQYMLENNVHYYDYPLKFDEHFLATHTNILAQIRNNTIIEFKYGNETPNKKLYVKQITVKYGDKPLPQYDITLTDDVEIVLNKIGQVTDDVSRLRLQLTDLMEYYGASGVLAELIAQKLSKVEDDIAEGRITFKQGLVSAAEIITESSIQSSGFVSGLYTGKGWRIDELGNAELESLRVRSFLEVIEMLVNRIQAMEGDTMFSDNDQIDKVTPEYENDAIAYYKLSLKEKWDGYVTAQMEGNILKGIINTLAAKDAGVSDETNNNANKQGSDDGGNKYYTSWMRVVGTHSTDNNLGVNEIRVVLYGDNDTPAKKNFAPCELMTIARWGCVDAASNASAAVKASVKRRQTVFYLSASEGRIVKLTGVNKPILEEGNYGMVFGTIPDFIKEWDSWDRLVAQHPHLEDRDYLFAQGLIYQDLVHVDIKGAPVPVTVDCGDWINGGTASGEITDEYGDVVSLPTIRHGIYFNVGWNPKSQQFERHTVRHNNGIWLCLQNQPVTVNGVSTYYEPEYNSLYWKLVDGDGRYRIEIESSNGDVFNAAPATTLTPKLFFGNVDITNKIPTSAWSWERSSESGSTSADTAWNNNHIGVRVLTLSASDYPSGWSDSNKAIFTAKVKIVLDGILSAYAFERYPSYTWGNPSTYPPVGTTVLLDYEDPTKDMIDVWEESSIQSNMWEAYGIDVGSIYLCSYDNHLYEATSNGWSDMGEYTGGVVSQRFIAAKVSNGTAIVVDLDNQMTNVACDKDGNVVGSSDPQLTTTINVYKGGTRQQVTFDDIDCEINNASILSQSYINGYKATADLGTGVITIYVQRGTNISNSTEVVITMGTSVDGEDVEHTLTFTIGGVRAGADGEPATLYELLPSKDAISFTRNASGGLTPSADSFYMEIKKTDGDGVSVIARQGWGTLLKVMYSATEPPDSTTVTTNVKEWGTDSSDITFSGNTAIVPNAGVDRIYLALFQLSDNQYVLRDRETIPVVKDGAKGNDGKTIQEVTIYKVQETKPSTPTGGSMSNNVLTPPENWLATPPSTLSTTRSGDFLIVQSGSKKGWRKAQGDKSDTQQFFKDTISFTTSKPNEYIKIHIVTSCEAGSGAYYDFACVGELDVNYTSRSQVESISDSRKADGESDVTIVTKIPTASSHSIQVIYTKDASSWSGEDCAWYRIEDLDIWASVSKFIDDVQSGSWSEPVRWNGTSGNSGNDGTNGRNGTNGVSYQIILQSASAVVSANGILNASVECTINRTSGVTTTPNYPTGSVQAIIGTRTVTLSKTSSQHSLELSNEEWSSLGNPKEIVLQYYTAGGQNPPILATTTVPITIQGQMGRNIYYAGMFDDVVGTTFTATDYEAPYVNIGTTSSPQCYVYVGDNGNIIYPSTAEGFANNSNWELMETNFNYLITKAMFSDFAKLGSAIFNKDYMFSQYLENEFVMLGSYQPINNTVYFEAINGQTSIPVTAGVTYTLLITCATTSGASVPVTFRVYYNTKSDWTGTEHAGVADVNNSSTTLSIVEHTFTAEYDGYVRLYGFGVGRVTKIASKASASYNEVSPMFLNGDDILLVINTQATNSTTQRSVVALPIPVNNGRQYTVSFYGYVGGGTGYVYVLQNGSNIASTSFSNTSPAQKSITFTTSASGNVYIQYKSSSSSYYTYIYRMYIKCNNPMIPKVAVNWLTGYAHFAGDNVRFNPDGSGFVAGGNISWDIAGNATFNGTINATGGNITGVMNVGNTSGYYVRLNPNSSGAYVEGVDYNSGNPITRFTLGFATDNIWESYKRYGFLKMGTSLLTDGFMKVGGKSSFITLPVTEDGTYAYMAAYSLNGPVIELSRKIGTTTKTFRASMNATTGQTIISLEGLSISGLPSSGTNTGDVYVDSNGFLRIKTS